jgi:hypothetical protein
LDILIKQDAENALAVYAALVKFDAPLEGLRPDDLVEKGKFFRMGTPPVMVDIMPEISGVDFDDAWQRRVEVTIDADTGLKAPFISEADLIAAKLAAARPQDLADVDAINKATGHSTAGGKPKRARTLKKNPPKP